jgi:hypothetical protein
LAARKIDVPRVGESLIRGVYWTAEACPILRAERMGDSVEVRPDTMFEMKRLRYAAFWLKSW